MQVIGHLNLGQNLFKGGRFEESTEYPLDSKVGTWAFINKVFSLCVEVDGAPFWLPLTPERNTYIFPQPIPSATWSIDHKFGSENVLIQCFDENNNVMNPSSIRPIDENISEVIFPDAVIGKAIVMYGIEEGAMINGSTAENSAPYILESDYNENGFYEKWSDGRLICRGTITARGDTPHTYPHPFVEGSSIRLRQNTEEADRTVISVVLQTLDRNGTIVGVGEGGGENIHDNDNTYFTSSTNDSVTVCEYKAEGRWK